jgi:DNA-binding winged helix-turn-helix (wHTH) protein
MMGSDRRVEVLTEISRKSDGAKNRVAPLVCGDIVIHFDSRRVRSASGVASLEPRVLDLLRCLAGQPGVVLPREDLIDAVWGQGDGSDEALSQAVAKLRRALGDDARAPRFIETVSKSGYRWVFEEAAPVRLAAPPAKRVAKPMLIAAGLAGAVVMAGLGGVGTLAYLKAAPKRFEIRKVRTVLGADGACGTRVEVIKGVGRPTQADLAPPAHDGCGPPEGAMPPIRMERRQG